MLRSTLNFREGNFNSFLNEFINYVRLHRGVRIIAGKAWNKMSQDGTNALLQGGVSTPTATAHLWKPYAKLTRLIKESKLGDTLTNSSETAIGYLQSIHLELETKPEGSPNDIITWPVLVPVQTFIL